MTLHADSQTVASTRDLLTFYDLRVTDIITISALTIQPQKTIYVLAECGAFSNTTVVSFGTVCLL